MTADALFDMTPIATAPPVNESADQRRTRRQRESIAAGFHPLSAVCIGLRLHPEAGRPTGPADPATGPTCGTCTHRHPDGHYPKCDREMTRSAASDCRAWWPACTNYRAHALTPPTTGDTP